MKKEEQRLPFSDYPVEEQERDVEKHKYLDKKYQPHVFLLKVDGIWAHIIFSKNQPLHKFYEGKNLFQTFEEIKNNFPYYKIKYIMNEGIENYLRDIYKKELFIKKLQLNINFNQK